MPEIEPALVGISGEEFDEILALQRKYRMDWPAVFSCNEYDSVWAFPGYGYSKPEERVHIEGESPGLDFIADFFLETRAGGGRFFVCQHGIYTRPSDTYLLVAEFVFSSQPSDSRPCPRHAGRAIRMRGPGPLDKARRLQRRERLPVEQWADAVARAMTPDALRRTKVNWL